ncbi:MAG: hypothetical protein WD738_04005 [Pirellulales bacterium]
MSLGSPKLARREQAIEATRRRLRRLEIEAHRIKAELARLEAEYEDDVADWLSRKLRRRASPPTRERFDQPHSPGPRPSADGAPAVLSFDLAPVAGVSVPGHNASAHGTKASPSKVASPRNTPALPQVVAHSPLSGPRQPTIAVHRKNASPLLLSFAVHALALSLCFTFTFATLVQHGIPLFASPTDLDEVASEQFSEVEIEPTKFDDSELQNVVSEDSEFNLADNLLREFEPTELGAGAQPLGDVGQLDALPSDLGTLMAGAGSPGGGKPGGPLGEAVFFGARSKGDRFVFVVDNSSSMKGGRLEAATAELLRTVDSLSPRQGFYVIFVSDQTYPMFFPLPAPELLPATAANKKRLADWLPKAILASGKNRELIKAMDMAAALRPHAVFLLWDGDLKYSEKVRLDVMTHFTRPNQWDFAIHTLGMGVSSLDAEYNLTAIAQAHRGTFRRVDVPTARTR